MQKLTVGVAGTMASGKTTASKVLKSMFPETVSCRYSDPLRMFYSLLHGMVSTLPCDVKLPSSTSFVGRRHTLLAHELGRAFGTDLQVFGANYIAFNQFALWLAEVFVPRHQGNWPVQASTEDLQMLSTAVRKFFGEDLLERAMNVLISSSVSKSPIIAIEGIRRLVDIGMFTKDRATPFFFVYLEATPEVRFARHKRRNEKTGDALLTYEQFLEMGQQESEQQILLLRPHADLIIDTTNEHQDVAAECLRAAVYARLALFA